MANAYFFGYGSLVNLATHTYGDAHPTVAHGWRREWRHTTLQSIAYLTAVPDQNSQIDGMIAHVPNDDWAALDLREHGYDRIATNDVKHPLPDAPAIAIYSIPPDRHPAPAAPLPILLSYLDVVAQGYLHHFGVDGLARFFATTSGWNAPVLNDRAAPQYPRAQSLTPGETTHIDAHLADLSVSIISEN